MPRHPHIDGPPTFAEGWRGIAEYVGRSERWCRYMALRERDPLPVTKLHGRVRLHHAAMVAWEARQERPLRDVAAAVGVEA